MSFRLPLSTRYKVALVVSLIFCGGAFAFTRVVKPMGSDRLANLRAKRDQLAEFTDDRVAAARMNSKSAWTDASIAELERKLRVRWEWKRKSESRSVQLKLLTPDLARWPNELAELKQLLTRDDVTLETLRICAGGPAGRRELLQLTVTFRLDGEPEPQPKPSTQ